MSEIDLLIQELRDTIDNQREEIDRLKDLCNKYEEEHKTAFKLWTQKMEEIPDYEESMKLKKEIDRLNNIINELEKWLRKNINDINAYFENTPFGIEDTYKEVLDKLKELKENK